MNHFVNKQTMSHCRSSEQGRNCAGCESQTEFSQDSRSDVCKRPRPVPQRSCTGSQNAPESMYVLRNCDRCQDYTVQPCSRNCKCAKRSTQCTGQCESAVQGKSHVASQKSLPESVGLRSESSKFAPDPYPHRRMGGTCPVCQHQELHQPGQSICPQCNEKVLTAVDNYYVQCKGQCQQGTGQPCPYQANPPDQPQSQQPQSPGQWHQLNTSPYGSQQHGGQPLGDQPFNIIVLQDCNNHALIDQLTTAINRGGGQVHMPTGTQPEYNYPHNYPNHPHNHNPLTDYIDYEYVDPNRKWYEPEREAGYDYGYDMGPWPTDPYFNRDAYEDDRYQHPSSCNSYDCPFGNEMYQKQGPWDNSPMNDQANGCPCEHCQKRFESSDKLAMLIAQALEIFVSNHYAKKEKQDPETKVKKIKKKAKRKAELALNNPFRKPSTPQEESLQVSKNGSKAKLSTVPSPNIKSSSSHSNGLRTPKPALHPSTSLHQEASVDEDSIGSHSVGNVHHDKKTKTKIPFFLPNCQEHLCKKDCKGACSRSPHDCGKGCKSHCRGPCSSSKAGGGDGRGRSKGSTRQRHSRCRQCNQVEGRRWQEMGSTECPDGKNAGAATGCAGCGASRDRNEGGGKNTFLGLSPIAHYRPGMLQFPVNYLLAGTNFRRRLVRTAAGVTLHQKPYVNMANAKDLPQFPCREKSASPECRTPAKKWL
ncbi:uncharacterized protein LOC108145198 [Drosophila elegans]|uniref:uncharacterized protein LOC108145198 n=1 Tax=Drosophila elegans TaxID=30023 RepID=UPI0007E671CE|nr:uncharacterized protein LOC108145198 [Drosophila elegans]